MTHTMLAVDIDGTAYAITNKDGRISFASLMRKAYDRGLRLCIITDTRIFYAPRYSSWTAPAWVHAIQPDARIDRTLSDAVTTITGMSPRKMELR